jgi:cytochrome b561
MNKNTGKVIFALLLAIVLITLMNSRIFTLTYHEIAGLAIGMAVVIHLVWNWQWLRAVSGSLFSSRVGARARIAYLVDLLLLVTMLLIVISGIFISKVLFPNLQIDTAVFRPLHSGLPYLAIALAGIHLGLSWNKVLPGVLGSKSVDKAIAYACRVVLLLVLAFGISQMVSSGYFMKLPSMVAALSGNAAQNDRGDRSGLPGAGRWNGTENAQNWSGQAPEGLPQGATPPSPRQGNPQDFGGNRGSAGAGASLPAVIGGNLGIMGAFAIVVYYLDRLLRRRRSSPAEQES